MSVLRRAYVKVAPDTTDFDRELKERLRKIKADTEGDRLGKDFGTAFTKRFDKQLKSLHIPPIDLKANPREALAAIDKTRRDLEGLRDHAGTVELRMRAEKALGDLRRFKKQLGDVGPEAGPEAASGFAASFSQKLGPLLAKAPLSGPVAISIAGAAALAAPLIGAAVSGAVIGGAGIGGVAGGLILASKDPRVKAAASEVGQRLQERLTLAGASFVGPAIDGLHEIEKAVGRINIEGILSDSSGFVKPLTEGISSALVDLGAGLEKLIHNAGPVVDSIGRGIAAIGKSLGDGLASLSDDGDAAANALDVIFKVIQTGLDSVFLVVNGLTEMYGWLKNIGALGVFGHLGDESQKFSAHMVVASQSVGALALTTEQLAAQQAQLKAVQDAVSASQQRLNDTLNSLGGATSVAGQQSAALKTAMDNLYGAAIRNTDANEAYQASWDSLTSSVQGNGRSLNIHTAAGRTNREALEGLLTSTNDLYAADIAAGVSVDAATKKHQNRTAAVKEEARHLGLNRAETQNLINTYGKIPGKKITDLVLDGVREVVRALQQLYLYQRSLATGKSLSSVEDSIRKGSDAGPSKAGGGFAAGGQIGGWSPNSRADNILAAVTAKEWVHPVDAVDYYGPQIMGAIQKRQVPREVLTAFASGALGKLGDLPFFAKGGQVAPVDTSGRWPFRTDVSRTRIPSRAEVASKVPIGAGVGGAFARSQDGKPYIWADAGPAGYDCSGIVSAVYNVLHGNSPYSHTFSTGSLPGHWFTKPGIGGPLTAAWSNPGESPASSTTGHMMGMVNGLTFESSGGRGVHLGASTRRLTDFAHIAHYNRGGQVPFASYDSGGYLPPGISVAHNGTGRPERVGAGDTYILNFSGPVASKRAAKEMILEGIKELKSERKLP